MNTQSRSRFRPLHSRAVALALVASLVTSIAGAVELLTNRSFDTAGGAGWTATSGWVEDPFAVTGEVNLHSWGANSGKLIEQKMTVWNVGGISGTAHMRLAQYSAPSGNTISIYLDYVTLMGVRKRLPLLNPSNSAVGFYPGGTDFSTGFTLPADLYILQGFSIDKNGSGDFRALEFSLDLQLPVVTLASPADAASFASGATIPLSAVVNTSGTDITSVAFYADGTLVGTGQRSVYGEWSLGEWGTPGSSHLSVMTAGDGSAAVDYNPPQPEAMYWSEGYFTSPL